MRVSAGALVLGIALLHCVGGGSRGARAPVIVNTVSIVFTQKTDDLPFDPRAARLQAATQQLTALAGHPITFQLDTALLPQWRSSFELALIEAIENVARDLDDLRSQKRAVFDFADPQLQRVECRYVATAQRPDVTFDAPAGTLRIALTSEASELVKRGATRQALVDVYNAMLDARFANAEPEQVSEVDAYFDYLTSGRRWFEGRSPTSGAEGRALTIWRVVRLTARIPRGSGEKSLYERARAWLVARERISFFADAYEKDRDAPPGPSFRGAEAAWVAWLNANVASLDVETQDELVRSLKVRRRTIYHPGEENLFVATAFPGFDYLGYLCSLVDRWIAAGHPAHDDRLPLAQRRTIDLQRTAMRALFEYGVDDDAKAKRLAAYLVAKRDAPLTKEAFTDFVDHTRYARTVWMWRAVEGEPVVWRAATRAIADDLGRVSDRSLLQDEARRLWLARPLPADRGPLLYLLTQIEAGVYARVNWADFPRSFGARITAQELGALFDQGYRSMWNAHQLWEALSPGWSRAAVVVPRLDAYLDQARADQSMAGATDAIRRLVSKMCSARSAADVAQVHQYLEKRVATHPSEDKDLATVLHASSPGRCEE